MHPRFFVVDIYRCSIKYRYLDSYERRGGLYMTGKSTHATWAEAHALLIAHNQQEIAKAQRWLASAIKKLDRTIALKEPSP
jgi:hypothetical protein